MVKITLTTGEEIIANSIYYEQNLAIIDYSKCDNCGLCATVCPKKLIKDSNVENLGEPNAQPINGPAV